MLGPGRRRLLLVVNGNKLLGANVNPGWGSTLPLLTATVGVAAGFAGSAFAAFLTDVFVFAFGASALATVAAGASAAGAGAFATTGAGASDLTFPVSSNSRKYPPDFLTLGAEPLS